MSTPTPRLTRELVRTAALAPSVHNSQPWYFRLPADDVVEVYADRSRRLPAVDPSGRDLVLSCGAAVHHLAAAAGAFGLRASVENLPRPDAPDLLAVVRLSEGVVTDRGVDLLAALENRKTDRRGAGAWPVPPGRVHQLADDASVWGAEVVVVTDPGRVARAEQLIEAARRAQLTDPVVAAEQQAWVDRSSGEGVPGRIADPSDHLEEHRPPSRFAPHAPARGEHEEHPDVLVAVCTVEDDVASWLRAGQTMSALWVGATQAGLATTPTSQVVEVAATRRLFQDDVLLGLRRPQVVLRVGWPAAVPGNPATGHTPRRPLEELIRE
jgi:nitroreductase